MSCIERFDQLRYPVRDHDIRSVDTDRASGHSKGLRCQLIPMGLSVVRDDNARVAFRQLLRIRPCDARTFI
jgi:hypothetical protein